MKLDSSSGVRVVSEIAAEMKASMIALAGERAWGETRSRWLERAARAAGISFRSAKSLFYAEDHQPRASTVEQVRRATAEQRKQDDAARHETANILDRLRLLEQRMAQVDPEFLQPQVSAFRVATHQTEQSQD